MQYILSLSPGKYHNLKGLNRISGSDHGRIVTARSDPEPGPVPMSRITAGRRAAVQERGETKGYRPD